jgi:hypothetical protein
MFLFAALALAFMGGGRFAAQQQVQLKDRA